MKKAPIRFPALLIGLIFVIICCAFTPYNNVKLQNSPLAGGHFPLASFGCLLLLMVVINPLLSLIRREWRFHLHELLLVWAMVTVATGVAYTGLMRTFIINITTPVWFSTTSSNLGQILPPLLPESLFPKNPDMIRTLYGGLEGGLDMSWWQVLSQIPWASWLMPMAWWGLFIIFVYTAMMGMVGVFSHQWVENEKMNFPLLRVPEILGEEAEAGRLLQFFTHRYFIIGFGIPLVLHLLNGLNTYFPQVPSIPTLVLASPYIPKEGLLSGFYKAKIYIYPAFIGFAFLTSKQVSFSLWSFFILGGLLPGLLQSLGWHLPAAALGTTFGPVVSRVEEMQMVGAFAVFFLFILWLARDHLKLVFRSFYQGRDVLQECHGLLCPRLALFIFLGGFVGVTVWLNLFGMDLLPTLMFLVICFMLQLVNSRLICQGGLPYLTLPLAPPDGFLAFFQTRLIAPLTLYMALVVQKVTFLDIRESLMPSLFHSAKLAEGSNPRFRFLFGILLAVVVGVVISFVAYLALYYKFGLNTLPDEWAVETSRRVHENFAQLLNHPEEPKRWSMIFTMVGVGVMSLLVAGYHQFIWWPLHPIGYLTTYSSAMQILWFGFFIGWLSNTLVLRYGGVSLFKEVRRVFIGLIVGDIVMAILWLIVGLFTQISYHALPL
jgi:hypothetical protein